MHLISTSKTTEHYSNSVKHTAESKDVLMNVLILIFWVCYLQLNPAHIYGAKFVQQSKSESECDLRKEDKETKNEHHFCSNN